MKKPGPPIEMLIDRLITIPDLFFKINIKSDDSKKKISVPAVLNDLLLDMGGAPLNNDEILEHFPGKNKNIPENNNRLQLISIICYIYEDDFFIEKKSGSEVIKSFILSQKIVELSKVVNSADEFISDPDKREELCRLALDITGYYPAGENEKNAVDRLSTLDSVERKKILAKTGAAQKRARELKEAMMRKEAEEAASKMSRE